MGPNSEIFPFWILYSNLLLLDLFLTIFYVLHIVYLLLGHIFLWPINTDQQSGSLRKHNGEGNVYAKE